MKSVVSFCTQTQNLPDKIFYKIAEIWLLLGIEVSEDEYDTPSNKHYWNGVTLTGQNLTKKYC